MKYTSASQVRKEIEIKERKRIDKQRGRESDIRLIKQIAIIVVAVTVFAFSYPTLAMASLLVLVGWSLN
jgi:hypothetical protein